MSIEAILRKRDGKRVRQGAEERTPRVFADISDQHKAEAFNLGLSLEQYKKLLENPDLYWDYLSKHKPKTQEKTEPINLHNFRKTQVTSQHSGTIFDTTEWDQTFNIKNKVK